MDHAGRLDPRALLESAEQRLFESLALGEDVYEAPAVFVLGSPRTGSTVCYQLVIAVFGLPYLSNFVNDAHPTTPALGVLSQAALRPEEIGFESRYGKTQGLLEPSEGSAVMRHWFGGEHPTQTRSARFLPGRREHCALSLAAIGRVLGPLVTKNAWNCFRVPELATTFPNARFVWIRRDIVAAARSDLAARYDYLGDPWSWSSASPANVAEIQQLHFTEQVVEAQYAYNATLGADLGAHATGRFVELWYEDVCADPTAAVGTLQELLGDWATARAPTIDLAPSGGPELPPEDARAIERYADREAGRLAAFRR